MGLFNVCKQDPLIRTLRETFGANIVRVPEQRVQRLCVVAVKGDKTAFRGSFGQLLQGSQDITIPEWAGATSRMADVSGKQSRSVEVGLGLDILGNFLSGFGVPSAGIQAKFQGATEVAFSFQDVTREWVDNNWLGRTLVGRSLDQQNVSAKLYMQKPRWNLLVIDSIITSKDFTISVTKSRSDSFAIDLPEIQALVGAAGNVKVQSASSRQLTFRGPDALTFAFTTVQLHVNDNGTILSMPPGGDSVVLSMAEDNRVPSYGLDHVELSASPAMVEWDEIN